MKSIKEKRDFLIFFFLFILFCFFILHVILRFIFLHFLILLSPPSSYSVFFPSSTFPSLITFPRIQLLHVSSVSSYSCFVYSSLSPSLYFLFSLIYSSFSSIILLLLLIFILFFSSSLYLHILSFHFFFFHQTQLNVQGLKRLKIMHKRIRNNLNCDVCPRSENVTLKHGLF